MNNNLPLIDPIFTIAEAARVVGIRLADIDNWMEKIRVGVLVPQGRRSVRRFSVEDLLVLRLILLCAGPTMPGSRSRTFMSPAAAFLMVKAVTPLRDHISLDADGYLKLPDSPAFMVVRCVGTDDHCTVDVLDGAEVAQALGAVDNQLLVIPLSRTVYEVVKACGEIVKASHKHSAAVARLARAAEQATAEAA